MLRIALTKGRIEKSAVDLIRRCGYDLTDYDNRKRRLIVSAGNLELVLAKAADVITYIERGVCDVGIVGRDTILESSGEFYELLDLDFGKCRFALAGIKGMDFYNGYTHKIVATKYPNVAKQYFASKGVDAEIVKIEGSVELAPLLGMADAIVDIVETGATLVDNGLEVYEDIADISARCIANIASMKLKNKEILEFTDRLRLEL